MFSSIFSFYFSFVQIFCILSNLYSLGFAVNHMFVLCFHTNRAVAVCLLCRISLCEASQNTSVLRVSMCNTCILIK